MDLCFPNKIPLLISREEYIHARYTDDQPCTFREWFDACTITARDLEGMCLVIYNADQYDDDCLLHSVMRLKGMQIIDEEDAHLGLVFVERADGCRVALQSGMILTIAHYFSDTYATAVVSKPIGPYGSGGRDQPKMKIVDTSDR